VFINFPDKYYGRKQYDANQIRKILSWFWGKYTPLQVPGLNPPKLILNPTPQEQLANDLWVERDKELARMRDLLGPIEEEIKKLDVIAKELDAVRK